MPDFETLLDAAVDDGRISETRKPHYRALHDRDPLGTERVLASLAPGPRPGNRPSDSRGYPSSWLPEIAADPPSPGAMRR